MSLPPRIDATQWNARTAAHLMARAGFGVCPSERERLARLEPEAVVASLLSPRAEPLSPPSWYQEPEADLRLKGRFADSAFKDLTFQERRAAQKENQQRNRARLNTAQSWWFEQMLEAEQPLEERLTLFLHGHFASSFKKVRSSYAMMKQHLLFRSHGAGAWGSLVEEVSRDPAMLVYLDNFRSNRKKPNENYARELLELFTLGEGNYSEDDILAAARALTGWSIDERRWTFEDRNRMHDPGNKHFLGEEGPWSGNDIIRIILQQPRAAEHLVTELWTYFAYARPEPELVGELSALLRAGNYELRPLLHAMFLHPAFYGERAFRTQIKSPITWSIHLIRMLEGSHPPARKLVQACEQLGQAIFNPPSVKGWDGGSTWITASTLALRYQAAEQIIRGFGQKQAKPGEANAAFRPERLLPDTSVSRKEARAQLFDRFYHDALREDDRRAMDAWMASKIPPPADWQPFHWQRVLLRLVQTPQFQLT